MTTNGLGVGIDLGTTFTAAAVAFADGRLEAVPLGESAPAVPSALFFPAGEAPLVGEPALRRGLSEPESLAREFKRRFGDNVPVTVGGTPYPVEHLYAVLLHWTMERVASHVGSRPESVVVSHPAAWGPWKLDLLADATRRAGLPGADLQSEPVCVARQYAQQATLAIGGLVGVYDFGGGTFDATVVRRTATGYEVVGRPEGLERLGGLDVDQAILGIVLNSVPELAELAGGGTIDPELTSAVAQLRASCVEAKHALSSDVVATVPVFLPTGPRDVRITRAELEAAIRPLLGETLNAFDRALSSAQVAAADLQALVLAGGSARIPLVGELLQARYQRPLAVDLHPKLATAYGAARLALAAAEVPAAVAVAPALPPSVTLAPPSPAPAAPADPDESGGPTRPAGTRRVAVAVAAVVLLAVALGGGFYLAQGSGGDPSATADPPAASDPPTGSNTDLDTDTDTDAGTDDSGGVGAAERSPARSGAPLFAKEGLEVLDAGFTVIDGEPDRPTFAVVVRNALTESTVERYTVHMAFFDAGGTKVGEGDDFNYNLGPGATGAVAGGIGVDLTGPAVEMRITDITDVDRVTGPPPPGAVTVAGPVKVAPGSLGGYLTLTGDVHSSLSFTPAAAYLLFVLRDGDGAIVCGDSAQILDLQPGATKAFEQDVNCPTDKPVTADFYPGIVAEP